MEGVNERILNLLRFTLKEFYECSDEKYEKVLDKVTNDLIEIAYENGLIEEVSQVLDEFIKE